MNSILFSLLLLLANKILTPKSEQAMSIADAKEFLIKIIADVNALSTVIRMAIDLHDKCTNLFEPIITPNAQKESDFLMRTAQPHGLTRSFSIYSENEAGLPGKHIASFVDLPTFCLITWSDSIK